VPADLEAGREGKKKSVWFVYLIHRPSGPDNEAKGNEYTTSSVTDDGCLPYKMALVMLTMLPGDGSSGYQSHPHRMKTKIDFMM